MTLTSATEDILNYLASAGGGSLVTAGTNGFSGFMPPSPDTALAVYIYGGSPPDEVSKAFELQGVQIKVRGETYALGHSLIDHAYEKLHGLTNETMNSKMYYYIKATSSIMQSGFDELKRPIFTVNFEVMKQFDHA